jgi:hypothetical protein
MSDASEPQGSLTYTVISSLMKRLGQNHSFSRMIPK